MNKVLKSCNSMVDVRNFVEKILEVNIVWIELVELVVLVFCNCFLRLELKDDLVKVLDLVCD